MEIVYCTAPNIFVAYATGYGITGCVLSVNTRDDEHDRLPGDGVEFVDRAAANAFAIERGYLEPYNVVRDEAGRYVRIARVREEG